MTVIPLCFDCRHLDRSVPRGTFRCAAFPVDIPDAILSIEHDLHLPYQGDHGIQFEPDRRSYNCDKDQTMSQTMTPSILDRCSSPWATKCHWISPGRWRSSGRTLNAGANR